MSPQRLALAGALAALLAVATLTSTVFAAPDDEGPSVSQTSSDHPILRVAYQHLDTHGGQCWEFVRNVVFDALGITMGFDYHWGFIEDPYGEPTGAVVVPVAQAQPGDIIQIADPNDTSPSADYSGLHTAIITGVVAPGVFSVIDSNANWDEWVTTREAYDVNAIVAEKNAWNPGRTLSYRIYRFPVDGDLGGWVPGDSDAEPAPRTTNPTPQAPPADLSDHRVIEVNTPGDYLNLRAAAGTTTRALASLRHGTKLAVLSEETVIADGFSWIKVSTLNEPRYEGWVAVDFTREPGTAGPATGGPTTPVMQPRLFFGFLAGD